MKTLVRARVVRTGLLCAALVCAALTGCGQTGVLYLPSDEGEVVSKGPDGTSTTRAADPAAEAEAARKRETRQPAPQ